MLYLFDYMKIALASPEFIRALSHGEVKKPETINYRTLKPERDGLFCERIFGPTRDWECHCGKYKRVRFKGTICDRCGVEVTRSKVRRERMGHIELAAPVSHIWYFKGIPSRMGLLLDMSPRALERVLYFASYVVLESNDPDVKIKEILTEGQLRQLRDKPFRVGMGAEAIEKLLTEVDLDLLADNLRRDLSNASGQKRVRAIRRLEVVEAFRKSGNLPQWMILRALPVIPPELRPMVQLDGGRFATSDLNDLYRRVINRNNRLSRLLKLRAPDIIVRNEKRMLQEAVDALIDNGRRGRPVTGPGNRPLKSLSDMLKGKQGRFRQNLLGKRVDYSGRSVIVVGPELKLHQCGLPKEMALELFKPFVMKKLSSENGLTIKAAKKKVDRATPEVWAVLEEVIKEHPVLLNRAPTLHRLGIQAFEPVLTEGRAIKLHPLACTAYNADFDGDQMAIHLPLSAEAQAEARVLMLAANHILAPKDGKPIIVPTQDMVLGTYYLTKIRYRPENPKIYATYQEALLALEHGHLDLQEQMLIRIRNEEIKNELVETTVGRLIFNEILPEKLRQFKKEEGKWTLGEVMNKKELGKLVSECFKKFGATRTAEVIDDVKRLGYHYACLAGITVSIDDVIIPPQKPQIISETSAKVKKVETYYQRGIITEQERYNKVIRLWNEATERVADAMMSNMDEFNPIYMMADSGARGNKQQMRQLAGMRGLMADPSGKIIDLPITANFREGLSVSDYFISSHGARKGLADTALRTADSGYLTRRLVDVAQDVIVRQDDCDIVPINLKLERALLAEDTFDALEILNEELNGRIIAKGINEELKSDTILDEEKLVKLGESGAEKIILKGTNLTDPLRAKSSRATETIKLGTRDESQRARLKEMFIHEHIGKEIAKEIKRLGIRAGEKLTHEMLETILEEENIREMWVRNGNIKGIEVEAITEGSHGIIESLEDRIAGRVLAEDIYDIRGKKIAARNELLTTDKAKEVCASLEERKTILKEIYDAQKYENPTNVSEKELKIYDKNGEIIDATEAIKITADKIEVLKDIYDATGNLIANAGEYPVNVGENPTAQGRAVAGAENVKFSQPEQSAFLFATFSLAQQRKSRLKELKNLKIYNKNGEPIDPTEATTITAPNSIKIRSVLTCRAPQGVCQKCYGVDLANQTEVEIGEAVGIIAAQSIGEPGTQLTMRTFHTGGVAGGDITQGLPRVEELFEARKPKNVAIIAEIEGTISYGPPDKNNLRTIILTPLDSANQTPRTYSIPYGIQPRVKPGEIVTPGTLITDGPKNPHDILRISGLKETHRYLVKEVQKVYKSQGVEINDKHIEVMVRQMLHKVKIEDSGSTEFLPGELVEMNVFESVNTKAIEENRAPAVAKPILLGITKASLATDSFLSAASFQETTRVLTDAAIKGKIDPLIGLKENVIIGKLIPAGTGMARYRDLTVIDKEANAE